MNVFPQLPPTASGRPRWNRSAWEFLENAGLLQGKYEIIDGEIILKMPQNYPRTAAINRLFAYAIRLVSGELDRIRSQTNITVPDADSETSRPEPDMVILREPLRRVPAGEDVLLAVEVSDTTLAEDLGFKIGLYARAGIEEYWVLDLPRRRLIAFRDPEGGVYQRREEFPEDSTVTPEFAPESEISLAELLPPLEN
jgi:Uma2 family endonuclease